MKNIFLLFILFWAFYCPAGHLIYFTDKKPCPDQRVYASDFYTGNRGNFPNGKQVILGWGNPKAGEKALCPICHRNLEFDNRHLKEIE